MPEGGEEVRIRPCHPEEFYLPQLRRSIVRIEFEGLVVVCEREGIPLLLETGIGDKRQCIRSVVESRAHLDKPLADIRQRGAVPRVAVQGGEGVEIPGIGGNNLRSAGQMRFGVGVLPESKLTEAQIIVDGSILRGGVKQHQEFLLRLKVSAVGILPGGIQKQPVVGTVLRTQTET